MKTLAKIAAWILAAFVAVVLFGFAISTPESRAKRTQADLVEADCERMKERAITTSERIAARSACDMARQAIK